MSENKEESKKSLLEQILEKGADFIKKPFVLKRVRRAFESAKDSIEEQSMDNEAQINSAREALVEAAKTEGNLKDKIQRLIDLQQEKASINEASKALESESKEFLGK